MNRKNNLLITPLIFAAFGLAACGSSGSGDSSGNNGATSPGLTPTSVTVDTVKGPLDPVQSGVSDTMTMVFAPTGTKGNAVGACADQAVVNNALDVGDILLNALAAAPANPTAAYQTALTETNNELLALISNLALTINVADGKNAGQVCLDGSYVANTNLVQSLPVLKGLYDQLAAQGSDPNLTTIASVVSQLDATLQQGLASTPAAARQVPVLGGALTLLDDLAANLTPATNSILNYNGTAGNAAIETLVSSLLVDATTKVVPVGSVSPEAAQQIANGINQLVTVLGKVTGPLLDAVTLLAGQGGALSPVLNPIELLLEGLLGKLPAVPAPTSP